VQVDQLDRGRAAVASPVVAGPLDAAGVVAGSFDDPGVGPVPPLGVEVLVVGYVSHDRDQDAFLVLRGEGRRAGGPAADDADGPLEFDPVGSMPLRWRPGRSGPTGRNE
jgi:hypothetical protein